MVDLNKVLAKARSAFKNKDKYLAEQLVTGSSIPRPTKPEDFIHYPNSAWHVMTQVPGIPFGRICQIAGKPDSGKSTHAMQFMKLAQDQGVQVILWDPESKFSAKRFDKFFKGKSNDLLVVTNKLISEGADLVESYVRAYFDEKDARKLLLVWDSVGATLTKSEKTDVTDAKGGSKRASHQMAQAAKENGAAVRGFVSLMEEFKDKEKNQETIAVLLINQTYANIGSVGQKESGGQKVEYHSSIIIQMSRTGDLLKTVKGVKMKAGITARAKVRKNHLIDDELSIAEMRLDITAGAIAVNSKDPAAKLVDSSMVSTDELEAEEDDGLFGEESDE
jgi:RecA/RadA recombinase